MSGRVCRRVFGPLGRGGTSAVEFALTASIFMGLMLMTMEVCYDLAVGAALDHGAWMASRFGTTGSLTAAGLGTSDRVSSIAAVVIQNGGALLSSPNLQIGENAYASFGGAAAMSGGSSGAGGSGQVVAYTLTYSQPYLTPIAAALAGSAILVHTSTVVVLNEPF